MPHTLEIQAHTRPQDNAGDAAAFIADVTAPPYSAQAPNARFVKTWRVRNTGRTAWNSGYSLVFVAGEPMGGPPQAVVEEPIPPGSEAEISVGLTAPPLEGTHSGEWQIRSARGELFGARLLVTVAVTPPTGEATAAAKPAGPPRPRPKARPPAPKASAPAPAIQALPRPAQPAEGQPGGILRNPAFDQGAYSRAGLRIPNHWDMWHAAEDTPRVPPQAQPFAKPQAQVLNVQNAPEADRDAFVNGDYCWKVWTVWRPAWVVLRQRLTGLTPNAQYRFTVPIHPDLVLHAGPDGKEYADDPRAGEQRLTASFGGVTLATVWMDGREVPFGATTPLTLDFSPTTSQATVAVELRARWGLEHTGWLIDGARLDMLPAGETPAPPPLARPARRSGPALRPRPAAPKTRRPVTNRPRASQTATPQIRAVPRPAPARKTQPPPPAAEPTPIAIRNRRFDLSLDGWQTWATVKEGDPAYQTPRFETFASPVPPTRVLAGRTALRIAAEAGYSFEAGVRQTVRGLAPGTPLRFSAHGQAWASSADNRFQSQEMGQANMRVGLDPAGGKDPLAESVVWSPLSDPWDAYAELQVEAVAQGSTVTLFLYSQPTALLKHNEVFWDDTALFAAGPAAALGPPAAEAEGASATDEPESDAETGGAEDAAIEAAPAVENLLHNAGFDQGFYLNAPELAVPEGWQLWCAGPDEAVLDRQDTPFAKPETIVWRKGVASGAEREQYFLTGRRCWRVRSDWNPVWLQLQQHVTGLTPGATYRFSVPLCPEPWAVYDGTKRQFANDPAAAEHRLAARAGDNTLGETGWLGREAAPGGEFTTLALDFKAEGEAATVSLELRARWGLARMQWVVNEVVLSEK